MKYKNDPRQIIAKFYSVCPETGKPINKGDNCIYYPNHKKCYHLESKTALQYRSDSFDMMLEDQNCERYGF